MQRRADWRSLSSGWTAAGLIENSFNLHKECLTPDPNGRPKEAGVLAARLSAHQANIRERLRRAEVTNAAAQAQTSEMMKTASERGRTNHWYLVAMMLLAGAFGVGGLRGLWWGDKSPLPTSDHPHLPGSLSNQSRSPGSLTAGERLMVELVKSRLREKGMSSDHIARVPDEVWAKLISGELSQEDHTAILATQAELSVLIRRLQDHNRKTAAIIHSAIWAWSSPRSTVFDCTMALWVANSPIVAPSKDALRQNPLVPK